MEIGKIIRSKYLLWFVVSLVLLQVLSTQMLTAMNGDVAFLLSMAKYTTLDGFYNQYYEVNPPLIVYLYKVFLWPSVFGLNEVAAANISMTLYLLMCLVIANKNLTCLNASLRNYFILAFCLALAAISENMFLQREHIISASLIVYVSHAISSQKETHQRFIWVLINSIVTAIAFALKPQYIFVLLFVEATLMVSRGKFYIRPMVVALFFFGMLYVSVILVYQKEYIDFIVPLAKKYYAGYFKSWSYLILVALGTLVCLIIPYGLLRASSLGDKNLDLLYMAAFGCLAAYVMGRAGFGYHLIPTKVIFLTINILAFVIGVKAFLATKKSITLLRLSSIVVVIAVLTNYGFFRTFDVRYSLAWQRFTEDTPKIDQSTLVDHPKIVELAKVINAYSYKGGGMLFLTKVNMYPHTFSLHNGMKWSSRLPNFWLLPIALKEKNDEQSATVLAMVKQVIAEDIRDNKPELILIEEGGNKQSFGVGFELLPFFLGLPEFKKEFSNYNLLEAIVTTDSRVDVYVRDEPRKVD